MKCSSCNNEFEFQDGMKFCPSCGAPLNPDEPNSSEPSEVIDEYQVPWEDRKKFTLINGFIETFKKSIFDPSSFFKAMPPKGDGFMPLLYAVVWVIIIQIVNLLLLKLFGFNPAAQIMDVFEQYQIPIDVNMIARLQLYQLFMLPIIEIISLVIFAGILHLFVMLVGANSNGFIATLRVVGYTQGVQAFSIIPVFGGFITAIYGIVLTVIGIKEVQNTSGGKATAAVLLPLIVCCGCLIFGIAMLVGMIVGSANLS
ncbi:MAG: YIP1 family protein [Calditrichia bacterium]